MLHRTKITQDPTLHRQLRISRLPAAPNPASPQAFHSAIDIPSFPPYRCWTLSLAGIPPERVERALNGHNADLTGTGTEPKLPALRLIYIIIYRCLNPSGTHLLLDPLVLRSGEHRSSLLHLPQLYTSSRTGEKQKRLAEASLSVCVGVNLFSRAVASQVFSAPVSLTTVFEMGTGGPSP